MKNPTYVRLQVGQTPTGRTYRLLLPIALQQELETQLGREFQQGEPWEVSLLETEVGYKICPIVQK